jgi:hypothetical protein
MTTAWLNFAGQSRTLKSNWSFTCELLADNEVRLVEEWDGTLVDPNVEPQEIVTAYARCILWSLQWLNRGDVRAIAANWT